MPTISVKVSKKLRNQYNMVDWNRTESDHISEYIRDFLQETIGKLPKVDDIVE